MKVFAPNRKNSSCQELGRQLLIWYSIREPLGIRVEVSFVGLTTYWDDSDIYREVKGNRSFVKLIP